MRFVKVYLSALLVIYSFNGLLAQTEQQSFELTPEIFTELVKNYHPGSYKAQLIAATAKEKLREARGKFDPELFSDLERKVFKESEYFDIQESGIKIPTRAGVEVKAGIQNHGGDFLNPENNVPESGLGKVGIAIPLQGLITDERRTALKQAKVGQEMARAEQIVGLNLLLYESQSAYWEWAGAYYQLQIIQEFESASKIRFEAVKNGFFQGDRAAIDTTEALIQWQEAQRMLQETDANYQKYYFTLLNYLWDDKGVPLEITEALRPINFPELELSTSIGEDSLSIWMDTQKFNHPKLQKFGAKQEILQAERRLKRLKLSPKVNFEYNILLQSASLNGGDSQHEVFRNNYTFGFNAKLPILLRGARGSLNQTKIKIEENELDTWQTQQEITNKVWTYFQQSKLLNQQVTQYRQTVGLYLRMVEAERTKFNIGESSLFLVNSRELKWIESREKYIKSKVKYFKTIAAFYEAMGTLHLQ